MRKYASHIIVTLSMVVFALAFIGCDEDTSGPTPPIAGYVPQTFSLAIANGAVGITDDSTGTAYLEPEGYAHNGNPTIKLDWNAEVGTANSVAATYVQNNYPLLDGAVTSGDLVNPGDDLVWGQAPFSPITLTPQWGNTGVTTVNVKAVYTYVNPARIWFLLQWDDPVDYSGDADPHNSGYWGRCWKTDEDDGDGFDDNRMYNYNEDWVAFMWDTWNRTGNTTTGDYTFTSRTAGFQNNGCAVTCHSTDATNPHYTNAENEVVDVWIWTATQNNYSDNYYGWEEAEGLNDPCILYDGYLSDEGLWTWGDPTIVEVDGGEDNEVLINFSPDDTITNTILNGADDGDPDFMSNADPGGNFPYLWNADDGRLEFDDGLTWETDDKISGFINRTALGGNVDVTGHGSYDVETGKYTLEILRNMGTYDNINNTRDTFIGIYTPHPGE